MLELRFVDALNRCGRLILSCLLAAVLIAGPLCIQASAQSFFWPWGGWDGGRRGGGWDNGRRPEWRSAPRSREHRRRSDAGPKEDRLGAGKVRPGPLVAVVSLSHQRIHVYDSEGLVAQSAISSGQPGYRTPTGVFSVIQKNRHHQSNIYSGAPMPWMHRITWSGIALHGGVVPGYPASHGCIRLTYDFAPRLWAMSRMGMRIIVAPQELTPELFSHPRLPAPAMTTVPPVAAVAREQPARLEVAVDNTAERATLTDRSPLVATAAVVGERTLNPLERTRAARAKALADATAAERAVKPAVELAQRSAAEANAASAAVRRAEAAVIAAERRLAVADRAAEAAKSSDAVDTAAKAQEAAREALDAARGAVAEAKAAETKKLDESFAGATAAKQALAAKEAAAEAASSSLLSLEPISMFVSRKEGRIFLRQGFSPLFDEAVTIRDPDRPLGTHVFTAMAAEDGGSRLRWTVVMVPDAGSRDATPAEALDRIEIPKEVRDEIANRLWAGASLIISDQGLGSETGKGTDFVVLTKY